MIVLDVSLEMLGQTVDAFREDRHLHFRRTGIAGLGRIGLDDFGLAAGSYRHRAVPFLSGVTVCGRAGMSSSAVTMACAADDGVVRLKAGPGALPRAATDSPANRSAAENAPNQKAGGDSGVKGTGTPALA